MRDYLLDTQIIRYWYDDQSAFHQTVVTRVRAVRDSPGASKSESKLLISVVTLGEIEFGHRVQVGDHAADNVARLRFLREQLPAPFELTADTAQSYAELRQRIFDRYAPGELRRPKMRPEQLVDPATALELQIQENDLWISAQAIAHGLILVTNDRMRPIIDVGADMDPPLNVENWAQV